MIKANQERLAELHEQHLQRPLSDRERDKAEQGYLAAIAERVRLEKKTAKVAKQQKRLAAKKRALQERHRAARSKMKDAEDALQIEVSITHNDLRETAREAAEARSRADEAAEALALTHGVAPIELGGVTYDFGCYGSKVYLVPRVKSRKRR